MESDDISILEGLRISKAKLKLGKNEFTEKLSEMTQNTVYVGSLDTRAVEVETLRLSAIQKTKQALADIEDTLSSVEEALTLLGEE